MGLLNFMKDAGEKLFGAKDTKAAPTATAQSPATPPAGTNIDAIKKYIQAQGISTDGINISFDSLQDKVVISGKVPDQETKEKLLLCCGNIQGVGAVEDNLTVTQASGESQFYTVKSGDTLSKIAKQYYGDANKYSVIFEANRPMLSSPDKIYPGQTLRIPNQGPSKEKIAQI
ncbi:peptidoglycan-binding protein LysM [Bdellovibrio sp. 22V]|uniref:peptidoglycan-binding protein LysM n=1 Tax=Bdellovibrio sp. 22V TaxID=3044166 RepID=UPI0025427F0C|nr:peptidoglycan-binding protein LysM [Bdellovibrio sp. 22V]WII73327.1 peptidoglycan-binding protein LysM [Bdellovibrio sp. 22V]